VKSPQADYPISGLQTGPPVKVALFGGVD
jgi:hypothetical protein